MKENRLSGNIMTDFGWGEYVIWHMAPASKVFIDGRYDTVYPASVIDDYLAFNYGEAGAKDFLTRYPHDFVLLSPNDEAALDEVSRARTWKQTLSRRQQHSLHAGGFRRRENSTDYDFRR